MHTDQTPDISKVAGQHLQAPKSSSRRRLLQAGLGAAPAILTIVSEPVRAFGTASAVPCRSASAFASVAAAMLAGGTTSANTQQTCMGEGPASWNVASTWPVAKTTLFSTVLGSFTLRGNVSPTLSDILNAPAPYTATEILARSFVAAYLNTQGTPKTPLVVVTALQLQAMWPQAVAGSFVPTPGTPAWTMDQVNTWLLQTFGSV